MSTTSSSITCDGLTCNTLTAGSLEFDAQATADLDAEDVTCDSLVSAGAIEGASLQAGAGTPITLIQKGTVTVNPADLAAGDTADESITISGAAVGDLVILQPPAAALTAGLIIGQAWVSATNTVKARLYNPTGGAINEASGTWSYALIRS